MDFKIPLVEISSYLGANIYHKNKQQKSHLRITLTNFLLPYKSLLAMKLLKANFKLKTSPSL